MVPALKFSANTSNFGARRSTRSRPASDRRSIPTLRLPRLLRRNVAPTTRPSGSRIDGDAARPDSPCTGCSTLTTSAPSRASNCVANGIAAICSSASTRTPSSGFPYCAAPSLAMSPTRNPTPRSPVARLCTGCRGAPASSAVSAYSTGVRTRRNASTGSTLPLTSTEPSGSTRTASPRRSRVASPMTI